MMIFHNAYRFTIEVNGGEILRIFSELFNFVFGLP